MGLKYNSGESSQIITAMENNLGIAKQASTGIQSGTQYLTSALVGGSLNGVAFNAGHTLFESIITPAENKVSQALDDVGNDLNAYKSADGQVSHYDILDEDNLNNQISEKKMQQFATNALLDTYRVAMVTNPVVSLIDKLTGTSHQLEKVSQSLDEDIQKLQKKLKALYQFSDQTSPLFRDNQTALQEAMQGVTSLGGMVLNSDGSVPSSYDSSWLTKMNNVRFNSNFGKVEKHSLNGTDYFDEFVNKVKDVGEWSNESAGAFLDSVKDKIIKEGKNIGKSWGAKLQPRDENGRFVADDFAPRKWLSGKLKGVSNPASDVIGSVAKWGSRGLVALGAVENFNDYNVEYHNNGRALAYSGVSTAAGYWGGALGTSVGTAAAGFAVSSGMIAGGTTLATVAAVALPVAGAVVVGVAAGMAVKAAYDSNFLGTRDAINFVGDKINDVGKALSNPLKSLKGAFGW